MRWIASLRYEVHTMSSLPDEVWKRVLSFVFALRPHERTDTLGVRLKNRMLRDLPRKRPLEGAFRIVYPMDTITMRRKCITYYRNGHNERIVGELTYLDEAAYLRIVSGE